MFWKQKPGEPSKGDDAPKPNETPKMPLPPTRMSSPAMSNLSQAGVSKSTSTTTESATTPMASPRKRFEVPLLLPSQTIKWGTGVEVSAQRGSLVLVGGDPEASSGGTISDAFSVQLPDEFEAAASGKRVRVSARVASQSGVSRIGLAYSTCEVGNSGWNTFEVGASAAVVSFEWDVPTMINGNHDYLGVLPPKSGSPPVIISLLVVEVIERVA